MIIMNERSNKYTNTNQPNATLQYNSKQYDKIRVLGKGSFGTAIVHRRRTDCSLVVLKEIDLQRFRGEREKLSAINEAKIMSNLSHVNIIKYHNAYITDTKLIIEMEYASIGTLDAYLSFQVQPLDEQEILVIFRQIASGLNYLHSENIVHLDLKMANIFVTIEGLIKIGDFGIAQYMHTDDLSKQVLAGNANQRHVTTKNNANGYRKSYATSSHLGTLAYSSPERCLGEPTDFKSDIWSLGCILYELITSKALFVGESLAELVLSITRVQYFQIKRNDITPALKDTFAQMIARAPEDRPSAKDLLAITGQLLARLQLHRYTYKNNHHHQLNKTHPRKNHHRFDLSTEVAILAANNQDDMLNQINYPHSLVYQVRLNARHIQVDRVNLPQTKRIKEMAKGRSHYLVLTYDNLVYGWGSKSYGQLGACGLSSSSNSSRQQQQQHQATISTSRATYLGSITSYRDSTPTNNHGANNSATSSSSLSSSTQTIISNHNHHQQQQNSNNKNQTKSNQNHLNRQFVMNKLEESQPTSRPFVINELNHRKIVQVAAGNYFSVFLSKTGIVMTCGDGSTGCLGRGDLKSTFTPCMVESLLNSDVICIACGPEHVVAVCGNGRAFAWGKSLHGRLGIGSQPVDPSQVAQNGKFILRPQPVQFPHNVFIKSVFCGDRSTIFIDSENHCWACGENRFNKLGLDVRRRFKKTLIVNRCSVPTEISSLTKQRIITCNIGKNHCSFITNDGKLIVFGQDIDHTYRLRSNIISSRDSHRRISFELSHRNQRKSEFGSNKNYQKRQATTAQHRIVNHVSSKTLAQSCVYNNQLSGFQSSANDQGEKCSSSRIRYPKYKLSRLQRQQIDSYMKKSRANKKMPFECVISVACTPKFSLALTSDNRVYFWGTRSYEKDNDSSMFMPRCKVISSPSQKSVEPQLVAGCSDECFIKIGQTNNSLMSNIQTLGSDQPIIHAQDPRLMAKSLSDLWILDYRPSQASRASSCSASSSSSSSSSSSHSSCCSWSCSSSCSSNSDSYGSFCPSQACCRLPVSNNRQLGIDENLAKLDKESDSDDADYLKHDAILEPQPIVSLYVPSMFNHNGSSLHLVDLFCFDEDRFYLVLDTTVKVQHHQHHHQHHHQQGSSRPTSGIATSGGYPHTNVNQSAVKTRLNSISEPRSQNKLFAPPPPASTEKLNKVEIDQPTIKVTKEPRRRTSIGVGDTTNTKFIQQSTRLPIQVELQNGELDGMAKTLQLDGKSNESSLDDNNNNNNSNNNNNLNNIAENTDATLVSSSQGGVSMEEPRSLSTFAANSLGNHIVVGPTMLQCANEQPLQQLTFSNNQQSDLVSGISPTIGSGSAGGVGGAGSSLLSQLAIQNRTNRRRRRQVTTNKSESNTTFTCNDQDETSSMPSWVRNEYIQHQQQRQQPANSIMNRTPVDGIFAVDSSATEDTFMSELSASTNLTTNTDDDEETDCTDDSKSQNNVNGYSDIVDDSTMLRSRYSNSMRQSNQHRSSNESSLSSSPTPEPAPLEDECSIKSNDITLLDNQVVQELHHQSYASSSANPNRVLIDGDSVGGMALDKSIKGLVAISRSQPDISDSTEPSTQIRRASIVNETPMINYDKLNNTASDRHQLSCTNNILDCNVYKTTSTTNHHHQHYLSNSNFNSALSSRSNSHNLLIRPDLSPSLGFKPLGPSSSLSRSQNNNFRPRNSTTGNDNNTCEHYHWSDVSDTLYQTQHFKQSCSIYRQQRQKFADKNRHLTQSSVQIHSATKSHKTTDGSTLSLASLRKSLVKLLC